MLADTAVLAYRNVLRIQGWIGSLWLVMERELFGQEPVSEANGATAGERIEREMHRLEQSLLPLLDRAHRMMVRSLDRLEARRSRGGPQAQLSIGHAGQVNVGSAVVRAATTGSTGWSSGWVQILEGREKGVAC